VPELRTFAATHTADAEQIVALGWLIHQVLTHGRGAKLLAPYAGQGPALLATAGRRLGWGGGGAKAWRRLAGAGSSASANSTAPMACVATIGSA